MPRIGTLSRWNMPMRLAHVEQRHLLRRRHHDDAARAARPARARAGRRPCPAACRRPGSRARPSITSLQHLLDERVDHRAAPHQRLPLVHEEADGHDLEAVRLDRDDLVVEHARACPCVPSMSGTSGPYTSQSMSPTVAPACRSASARFTATVDLPTPPLPDDTAMRVLAPRG